MAEAPKSFEPTGQPTGRPEQSGIIPLSETDKARYKTVIYGHQSLNEADKGLVSATVSAMQGAGFEIAVDRKDTDRSGQAVVIKSASAERKQQMSEGALCLGVIEATRRRLEGQPIDDETAYATAQEMLQTVTGEPEVLEAFSEYYGGLRWGSDQERFVRTLFRNGTEFDSDFLDQNLSGGDLSSLVYELDANISYDQRRDWHDLSIDDILSEFPELDYRRLNDEQFRESEEGQTLLRAYKHLSGEILARRQKNHEPVVNNFGEIVPEPAIPLSSHPVIEALVIDEMSLDRPQPKYSFGPSELAGIILDSDSVPAHEALVRAITTRLPEGARRVSDGPDEFQFKRGRVVDLLREYRRAENPDRRVLLRDDLIQVLDAFTMDGEIASTVREDYHKQIARGTKESWARSEASQVNGIVLDALTVALASPDPEVSARASSIVEDFIPQHERAIAFGQDPLILGREQMGLALIDAIDFVAEGSNLQVFESLGTQIFGDRQIGEQLRRFAETKMRIVAERSRPEVLQAFDERRSLSHSNFGGDKTPEYLEAEARYDALTRYSDELAEALKIDQQNFFLDQAEALATTQRERELTDGEETLFGGVIKRIKLGDYHMTALPAEYHRMMDLAKSGDLTERQVGTIAWQVYESFKYVDENAAHLMIPTVLDIYEIALGSVDEVRFPTGETSHILGSASGLVREHGRKMFRSASIEDLQVLASYSERIRDYAVQVAENRILPDVVRANTQQAQEWRKDALYNLESIARELKSIDSQYEEYLHIEAVKVKPSEYYPWVLGKLVPFWQKMQWEVGPGNRPGRDIQRLHGTIADYVKGRFVIQDEYPDDFDANAQGQIGAFLYEMYTQMVVPHDIKYNGTVWREGLTFMHNAIAYMPETVLRQIQEQYPNTDFARYIEKERGRWTEPKDDIIS
ncbi:hypothetical protein JW887_00135 [Candidatus Dojkabacteria bacterium]|nr:hypothetical protein [Candidatus Dojkabacteria bacterium]